MRNEIGLALDKDHFEELFQNPDPWNYLTSDYEQRKYDRQIALISKHHANPERILEIGCAEGLFTKMLAEHFRDARITVIDISSSTINRATENLKSFRGRVEFVNEAITEYADTLPERNFDVCVFSETVYFLPRQYSMLNTYETLERIVKTLRVGGILVMANAKQSRPLKIMMQCILTMLSSLARIISNSSYEQFKTEDNRLYGYEIWVFERRIRQPQPLQNLKFLKDIFRLVLKRINSQNN